MKTDRRYIVKTITLPRTPEMELFAEEQSNFSASVRTLISRTIYEHGEAGVDIYREYQKQLDEQVFSQRPKLSDIKMRAESASSYQQAPAAVHSSIGFTPAMAGRKKQPDSSSTSEREEIPSCYL